MYSTGKCIFVLHSSLHIYYIVNGVGVPVAEWIDFNCSFVQWGRQPCHFTRKKIGGAQSPGDNIAKQRRKNCDTANNSHE